jgi:hypothetical protein
MIAFASAASAADEKKPHRLSIHVDQNDPQVMNLALKNATNVIEYYRGKKEDVDVDIVTYGPGLHMLRADTSPVQDRLKRLKELAFPARSSFPPATIPSRAWRRPRASRSPLCPTPPSFPRAWSA